MSGILGFTNLAANTNTTIYTVPTGKVSSITINACNTTNADIRVSIALSTSASPVAGEWIEWEAILPINGVLERGGIVLGANQRVVAKANATDVNINVWGFEENE